MANYELFYATNRSHEGDDRWNPTGYGPEFSKDGLENLRFGKLTLDADDNIVEGFLKQTDGYGVGNGIELSGYLKNQAEIFKNIKIMAYQENIPSDQSAPVVLGSHAMFEDVQSIMANATDVVVLHARLQRQLD